MKATELIEILREHPDATIYTDASWGELTNKVEAVFQSATEYYRTNDAVVIRVRDEAQEGGEE